MGGTLFGIETILSGGEGKIKMRIAVLGLGVIGTTYAYALQKAGHETFHIVREGKNVPSSINVHLLDGRYNPKGEEKDGDYSVKTASQNEEYDFILISVASGKLKEAMRTLRDRNLKGTVILFCNFWNERKEVEGKLKKLKKQLEGNKMPFDM